MSIFVNPEPCSCGECPVCACAALARHTRERRLRIAGDRTRTLEANVKRVMSPAIATAVEREA